MAGVAGKRIVFTGELESMTKAEAQAKARSVGATVGSTGNAETDLRDADEPPVHAAPGMPLLPTTLAGCPATTLRPVCS